MKIFDLFSKFLLWSKKTSAVSPTYIILGRKAKAKEMIFLGATQERGEVDALLKANGETWKGQFAAVSICTMSVAKRDGVTTRNNFIQEIQWEKGETLQLSGLQPGARGIGFNFPTGVTGGSTDVSGLSN